MPACSVTQATYIFNVSGNVTLTVSVNDLGFWRSFSRCSTAAAAVIQPYRSVIIFRIVSVQPSVFWGLLHFDGLSFSSVSAAKWWPKVGRPPRPLDCTSAGLPVRTAGTESVNTVRMWPFLNAAYTWRWRGASDNLMSAASPGDQSCRRVMMMSWCLMSSDVIWHIRDKLWPMPKHGSIKSTYVRCKRRV